MLLRHTMASKSDDEHSEVDAKLPGKTDDDNDDDEAQAHSPLDPQQPRPLSFGDYATGTQTAPAASHVSFLHPHHPWTTTTTTPTTTPSQVAAASSFGVPPSLELLQLQQQQQQRDLLLHRDLLQQAQRRRAAAPENNPMLFRQAAQALSTEELRELVALQRLHQQQTSAAAAAAASLLPGAASLLGASRTDLLNQHHPSAAAGGSSQSLSPLVLPTESGAAAGATATTGGSLESLLERLGRQQAFQLPAPSLMGASAVHQQSPQLAHQQHLRDHQERLRVAAGLVPVPAHHLRGAAPLRDDSESRKRRLDALLGRSAPGESLPFVPGHQQPHTAAGLSNSVAGTSSSLYGAAEGLSASPRLDLAAALGAGGGFPEVATTTTTTSQLLGASPYHSAALAAATAGYASAVPPFVTAAPASVAEPPRRKRYKRKKKKDDQPNRPLTAYNIFFKDERARLLSGVKLLQGDPEDSANLGFAEMAQTIAGRWKTLDKPTKDYYLHQAALDRQRYDREMAVYNAREKAEMEVSRARLEASLDDETRAQYMKSHGGSGSSS